MTYVGAVRLKVGAPGRREGRERGDLVQEGVLFVKEHETTFTQQ